MLSVCQPQSHHAVSGYKMSHSIILVYATLSDMCTVSSHIYNIYLPYMTDAQQVLLGNRKCLNMTLVMWHAKGVRVYDLKYNLHELLISVESGSAVAEGGGRVCKSSGSLDQLGRRRAACVGVHEHKILSPFTSSLWRVLLVTKLYVAQLRPHQPPLITLASTWY